MNKMKTSVGKDRIVFTTENDFETAALKQWEGKATTVNVETYQNGGYYTTGFIRIQFISKASEAKPNHE